MEPGSGPKPSRDGVPIVITAPLTETIDHAGYFIQMSMASLPMWLEGILNRKYPDWRKVEHNADGSAARHLVLEVHHAGINNLPRPLHESVAALRAAQARSGAAATTIVPKEAG